MQYVPSGQEYRAESDPPAWGMSPLMMAYPPKEGYKKRKKGKSWGLENGGREKHKRQVRKNIIGNQRIMVGFLEKGVGYIVNRSVRPELGEGKTQNSL